MFDTGFAQIFRAIDRIRLQLESADAALKQVLAEELACLRRLGDQYMDHWMALDEQIGELVETHGLSSVNVDSSDGTEKPQKVHGTLQTSRTAVSQSDDGVLSSSRTWNADLFATPFSTDHTSGELAEYMFDQSDPITVHFRKGMGYFDLFMFEDAIDMFSSVVQESNHVVARLYLAASLVAQKAYEPALSQLSMLKKLTNDVIVVCAACEIEAQIHIGRDDISAATRSFLDITLRMPDYQDVWFNLGVCHAMRKDYLAAEQALTQSLADYPNDPEAGYLLAAVQLFQNRLQASELTCRRILGKFPRDSRVLHLWSQVLAAMGRSADAIQICRKLHREQPDDIATASQLAWLFVRAGKLKDAAATLKKHAALKRDSSPLHGQLGLILMLSGEYDTAEKLLLDALDAESQPAYIWLALGQISAHKGDYPSAYQRYLRVLKDPRKVVKRTALYYFGATLFREGKFLEAEKYFKAAALLGNANPAIWLMLGRTAEKLGRNYEAEKLFARAGIVTSDKVN